MTRAQLEELCDDLMERAVAPVHAALKAANLTLDDVNAIELIGGGMRVPKVQTGLSSVLGDLELGMHINSDESMALGAAFFGANLSTAFRVRHVGLVDINPFPIGVVLEDLEPAKKKDEEEWKKEATIFKENGKVGVKKTIAFTHDKDVHCALDYAEPDTLPAGAKPELQRYKLTGVAEFAKEMEEKGLGKPKVSLQFELSQSGTCSIIKAEAAVEETYTMEVEVEVEDEESEKGNETDASAEENKERKTEETGDDETKEADGSDNSTADDTTAENATIKEEPQKKQTKMVEKVSLLWVLRSAGFAVSRDPTISFLALWSTPKHKTCFRHHNKGDEKDTQEEIGRRRVLRWKSAAPVQRDQRGIHVQSRGARPQRQGTCSSRRSKESS